ncbi:MAG: helix-turn-helix transcriptional regulator [Variovorax sp.]|nr:helix-turn-helix transcriptional regulator [Variovorax sp.]
MLDTMLADADTNASAWELTFARLNGPAMAPVAEPAARPACLRAAARAPLAACAPREANDAIAEAFRQAFELTLAEARVLAALMAGELPKRYALRMGLSINTVRSQIAALMWKMGCQRQLDLVRKAMSLALENAEPGRVAGCVGPL